MDKKSEKERAKENVGAPTGNCQVGFGMEKKGKINNAS